MLTGQWMRTETVTLVFQAEAGPPDAFGNPTAGAPRRQEVAAWVEPLSTQQNDLRRSQVTYGYRVNLPEMALDGLERVEWRGESYRVVGEPLVQPAGFIAGGFTRVDIQRIEG